jgi:hypothetical protein
VAASRFVSCMVAPARGARRGPPGVSTTRRRFPPRARARWGGGPPSRRPCGLCPWRRQRLATGRHPRPRRHQPRPPRPRGGPRCRVGTRVGSAGARCGRRHTASAPDALGRRYGGGRGGHAAPGAGQHGEAPWA